MSTATLRSVGGSTMVTIPPALLDQLGLAAPAKVTMRVEEGRLVIEPRARPRYTLEGLMAECDLTVEPGESEHEWQATPARGQEMI